MELQAPAQQHYLALSHILHSVWLVIFHTCIGDREGKKREKKPASKIFIPQFRINYISHYQLCIQLHTYTDINVIALSSVTV